MLPVPELRSPRLFIRPYQLSDARSLFQLVESNRAELSDYFPMTVQNNTSVMAKRKYILEHNAERNAGSSVFAGIFTSAGQLIGQIFIREINWRVPKCEMGYFIDKNCTGKGFGTEAMELFCTYCFQQLRMVKISLRIEASNAASRKLAQKCGFSCIGLARNDFRTTNGRLMDCEIWEKIPPEIIP